jgi:hypothetical protein
MTKERDFVHPGLQRNAPSGGATVAGLGIQMRGGLEKLVSYCHGASIGQSLHVSK